MLRRRPISLLACLSLVLALTIALAAPVLGAAQAETAAPTSNLTRAGAATMLVEAFKLSPISPLIVPEKVEKKFTYADSLLAIDESFAVPSADDIVAHPALKDIEGILKVRALAVTDGKFSPDAPISKRDFALAVARIVFGVDEPINYVARAAQYGVDLNPWMTDKPVTEVEAAAIVDWIVGNPEFTTVTMLVTTDIHGHIEPFLPGQSKHAIGGMSRMAKFVEEVRGRQPNTLLLDVGDAPYNTNVTNLFEGKPVMEIMNYMGYDAMCLGNHDFDFPQPVMERNARAAKFPFLSANTYRDGEYPGFLKPSIVKEVAGIRFAIIGLTDDESAVYTHPNNVKGITFKDHFVAAKEQVDAVRGAADVVIALAHLHGDNLVLPDKVRGIDIELAGGTDIVAFPQKVGNTWVISSGKHSELVSQLNMNFFGTELLGFNFGHVFMTENLPEDGCVTDLVRRYSDDLNAKMGEAIGATEVFLDGERGTVRLKESNLGNLVADSLRDITGADIALQNGGGVRASINVGPITLKDVYTVLPFDNRVVMIEATGKTIWEALENGVASYPSAAGAFLQVSGVEYTFDAAAAPGKRVVAVTVNGQPIDLGKTYKVVANDFLTGGGDHYDMLKSCRILLDTKLYLRDAMREYVIKVNPVSPGLEGRITVLNEPVK